MNHGIRRQIRRLFIPDEIIIQPWYETGSRSRLWVLWIIALALVSAGGLRFVCNPTFWLDEAFVAVNLKQPSVSLIFNQLEYGQYFPRLYLALIAATREIFGYQIWSLRLVPFLFFIAATLLWARLLLQKAFSSYFVLLIGAGLLAGSGYWLDQSVQLKQYSMDVFFALIPFVLCDEFYEHILVKGKWWPALLMLVAPCIFSYTYPFALAARIGGWYLIKLRDKQWKLNPRGVTLLLGGIILLLTGIWWTDHRFNILDKTAYLSYWHDCLLCARFNDGFVKGLRVIAKFIWGWHGHMPMVTTLIVPLQILGIWAVVKRFKLRDITKENGWGSRSIGSILLLAGMLFASGILNYPICAGRTTLFTQAHTQILALEGGLVLLAVIKRRAIAILLLCIIAIVVGVHSVRGYVNYIKNGPEENLRLAIKLIDSRISDRLWVHPCSIAQVKALPDEIPIKQIIYGTDKQLREGSGPVWILWTHLGTEECREELDHVKMRARSWVVVMEGTGCGLALAEF